MTKYKITFLIIIAIVFSVALSSSNENYIYSKNIPESFSPVDTNYPGTISTKDAYNLILENKNNPDFMILDVRTKAEVDTGYIEGSLNIDFKSPDFKDEILKLDKNKVYLLYCKAGGRSKKAMDMMVQLGFPNVVDIGGGITQWIADSLPIVK
jgi:rhodanese-related sulfurtransferase